MNYLAKSNSFLSFRLFTSRMEAKLVEAVSLLEAAPCLNVHSTSVAVVEPKVTFAGTFVSGHYEKRRQSKRS